MYPQRDYDSTHVHPTGHRSHNLPRRGPANHNSHIDTLVLLSLFPASAVRHIVVAVAADYWLSPNAGFIRRFIVKYLFDAVGPSAAAVELDSIPVANIAPKLT